MSNKTARSRQQHDMHKDDSEKIPMKLRYMYIYVTIKMTNLEITKR